MDDFVGRHWSNFAEQMRKVLPEASSWSWSTNTPCSTRSSASRIRARSPIRISGRRPSYLGVFEDNDPANRLMMIVNYNQDISEYWEWSDTDLVPIDLNNEAYKLGVNYVDLRNDSLIRRRVST